MTYVNVSRNHLPAVCLMVVWFCAITAIAQDRSQNTVAFTFDDLPATHGDYSGILPKLAAVLTDSGVPAIGFVNEIKLYTAGQLNQRHTALLRNWVDSGFDLGNHTYSHVSIDDVTPEQYMAEIERGEKITKQILSAQHRRLQYYRHPQLRTGPTGQYKQKIDSFLLAHRYITAPVTIDNNDYIFANLYSRAKQRNDTAMMRYVGVEYLQYMDTIVGFFEHLSIDFLGYNVRHILLLHASELNAEYLDDLIGMFERRRYKFISLHQALQDPAYKMKDAQSVRGLSWIHRWMASMGKEIVEEPSHPDAIRKLYQEY